MTVRDYVNSLSTGEKITLRYHVTGKERTFGTYVTDENHHLHAFDHPRSVHEFDDLEISDVSVVDDRLLLMVKVSTAWLNRHPKWKKGLKLPLVGILKDTPTFDSDAVLSDM